MQLHCHAVAHNRDDVDGICLVAGLPKEADDDLNNIESSGASCPEASAFAEYGGYLSMGGEGVAGVTLFLLPNDVAQLIATSCDAGSTLKGIEVERIDGEPFTIQP